MCLEQQSVSRVSEGITHQENSRSGRAVKHKMSFASDKLYDGYIRTNMSTIVSKVKVREIVVHLPCLTPHDREIIEAKRETSGNYNGMGLLLDCLKRREGWPEQFIKALESLEHKTLAAELRAEYDALKGDANPRPSPPPTTVVRAHVHPTPSAGQLSVPESGCSSQGGAAPPAGASAPPEPASETPPPLITNLQPEVPQRSTVQVPAAAGPPVPEPLQSTDAEVAPRSTTPPPSPETRHPETTPPSPPREMKAHCDSGVIPEQVSSENNEVSSAATAQPTCPEQCEKDAPTTSTTEVRPPQSLSSSQESPDAPRGSAYTQKTPEKPPVQDTAPPVGTVLEAAPQPEESTEPPAAQVVASRSQTEHVAVTSSLPAAAVGIDSSLVDDASVCLSKPGNLISIRPPYHSSHATVSPAGPYSGGSDRLEISHLAPDTAPSAQVPASSPVSSCTVTTASALPCEENGLALIHNEPEENHYESACPSLTMQEVLENVVHVAEEPPILNLDGQRSIPPAPIVNGEAAKEIPVSPPTTPADPETAPRTATTNTKYILGAAGVGACALLMAWKFKN